MRFVSSPRSWDLGHQENAAISCVLHFALFGRPPLWYLPDLTDPFGRRIFFIAAPQFTLCD